MNRSNYLPLTLLSLGIGLVVAAPAHAASASFEIRGYVPVRCSAAIQSFDVRSGANLTIDAIVNQSCNSSHRMSVAYLSPQDLDPADLAIDYAGRPALAITAHDAQFGDEGFVKDVRRLRLVWARGSEAQRNQFSSTVTVVVTPL